MRLLLWACGLVAAAICSEKREWPAPGQEHDDEWPHSFDTHNCSLPSREKKRTNVRDFERIKDSDVLIIPSESEFAYNISGRISNILMGRSWGMVEYMRQALKENPKPRKIILLTRKLKKLNQLRQLLQ